MRMEEVASLAVIVEKAELRDSVTEAGMWPVNVTGVGKMKAMSVE